MKIFDLYHQWTNHTRHQPDLYQELQSIQNDPKAIEDRFYRELEFGTGGLRGVLGAGTNRMNLYTVGKATQGYSHYLKQMTASPSVAIGYDSRINSCLFAKTAASIFAANGILVYLYAQLMPTPALSFAVRDLQCTGGIVITASHNPAQYNGYKVYGSDGCQITNQAAQRIQHEISLIDPFAHIQWGDFEQQISEKKIVYLEDDMVCRYLSAVSSSALFTKAQAQDLSIVYTPLNGAGISCVPRCLEKHGFTHLTIPSEQKDPDGHFPTCPYPNPEMKEALAVGLQWAETVQSDLLLATDPDCDRVGAAVRGSNGYELINGNEMGILLLDFICQMRLAQNRMPHAPVAVKTIVTTPMAAKIAQHYGVELRDVLTGFKYIGEQIGLLEQAGEADRYIFGFEESYGYLSGTFVRDKDAVNASLLICEMVAYYQAQSKTLLEVLQTLYQKYGFYQSRLLTFDFDGASGFSAMQHLIEGLRSDPPKIWAHYRVEGISDYQTSQTTKADGTTEPILLPQSNVLRFFFQGGCEAVVRPSGTEPKLKVYITSLGNTLEESMSTAQQLADTFTQWVQTGQLP